MSDPRKHHYVPVFLLERWHSGPDNRLSKFGWEHRRFVHLRRSATVCGCQKGLYRLASVNLPEIIETSFLQAIDNDGALVHKEFLALENKTFSKGQKVSLDGAARRKWSRLIASLLGRHPRFIKHLRKRGEEEYFSAISAFKSETEMLPDSFDEWLEHVGAAEAKIMGMVKVFPELITSPNINAAIYNAHWKIRRYPAGAQHLDYVLADRPVVRNGPLNGRFMLAMPLSPRHVFFAYSHSDIGDRIDADSSLGIIKKVNYASVRHACDHVFAKSDSQAAFIRKHMRLPHEVDAEALPGDMPDGHRGP